MVLVEQYVDFAYRLDDCFVGLSRGSVVSATTRTETVREDLLARVPI